MRRGIAVLAAFVVGAVTACSDPRAGTLPPPSPTPIVTPSATATPTPTTRDQVIAAARHFYDVLSAAAADPRSGAPAVERLMHPNCDCRRIADFLREQAARDRRIERAVKVRNPSASVRDATRGTVFLTLEQGAGRVVDEQGRVIERLDRTVDRVVLDFALLDSRWVVTQLTSSPR